MKNVKVYSCQRISVIGAIFRRASFQVVSLALAYPPQKASPRFACPHSDGTFVGRELVHVNHGGALNCR